jgi:hypothetical protein
MVNGTAAEQEARELRDRLFEAVGAEPAEGDDDDDDVAGGLGLFGWLPCMCWVPVGAGG